MAYDCQTVERQAQPTLAVRTHAPVGKLPEVLGQVYGNIAQYLMGELHEQPAGAPYVAYFNMDMQDLDMEIGFPVGHPLPGKGEIAASEIPGGKAATVTHVGPYNTVEQAYAALSRWMQEQGLEPTGVAYETYVNDPQETPPELLRTIITFPLKGAS